MVGKSVICLNCKWIAFEVTLAYVRQWEKEWEELFNTKSKEWLGFYGITDKPPSAKDNYGSCHRCGGSHKNFRDATDAEIAKVYGSTINPVLNRDEDLE